MHTQSFFVPGFRMSVFDGCSEVGHAYFYVLRNDAHASPTGLLEDLYVAEGYRSRGYGTKLLSAVVTKAQENRCYKLIAMSRNDGTRCHMHAWYMRMGFVLHGTEFRMNLLRA